MKFPENYLPPCAENPTLFDPHRPYGEAEQAMEVCASCPFKAECEIEGRRLDGWGVWGGVYLREGKPGQPPLPVGHQRKATA